MFLRNVQFLKGILAFIILKNPNYYTVVFQLVRFIKTQKCKLAHYRGHLTNYVVPFYFNFNKILHD